MFDVSQDSIYVLQYIFFILIVEFLDHAYETQVLLKKNPIDF